MHKIYDIDGIAITFDIFKPNKGSVSNEIIKNWTVIKPSKFDK